MIVKPVVQAKKYILNARRWAQEWDGYIIIKQLSEE